MKMVESTIEEAALSWLGDLGYTDLPGPQLAPGEPASERGSFGEVVLAGRLREALYRLNPGIPEDAREDALRKVTRLTSTSLVLANRAFHAWLRDGVPVEYPRGDGSMAGDRVRLIAFDQVGLNDWLVVNQFTVAEGQQKRRPDVVVFVNGLPLGLVELKNAADAQATLGNAHAQVQTYGGNPLPAPVQRGAGAQRRAASAHRVAHRQRGVVQNLAHHHRRHRGPRHGGGAGGAHPGCV